MIISILNEKLYYLYSDDHKNTWKDKFYCEARDYFLVDKTRRNESGTLIVLTRNLRIPAGDTWENRLRDYLKNVLKKLNIFWIKIK